MKTMFKKRVALVLFSVVVFVSGITCATTVITHADSYTANWITALTDPHDLLQTSLASTTATGNFNLWTWCPLGSAVLTDGQFFVWPTQFATWTNNAVVEYYLNTSVNTYGYTITGINTYGGWNDGGRDAQQYSIYYSVVGSEDWVLFDSVDYNPANPVSPSLSRVDWSTNLQNIDAIKFLAPASVENGSVGFCEIDVVGTPSPKPSTVVEAGEDQAVWLADGIVDVSLKGTVTSTVAYTVQWSIVNQSAGSTVVFTPATANAEDLSVQLDRAGTYVFKLSADDGTFTPAATTTVTVYADTCSYAQHQPGFVWMAGDINYDCQVNLEDLVAMAEHWLGTYTQNFVLIQDGQPTATIVVAQTPTPSANFAALELRYHIKRISGLELPIVNDSQTVTGNRILVGHSNATAAHGISVGDLDPLEYRIQIAPDTIILIGRDWQDTPANRAEAGRSVWGDTIQSARQIVNYNQVTGGFGPTSIELPGLFDDQGTCYAVYDFLERFCGIRWYGPSELNIVSPSTDSLVVTTGTIQRNKDFKMVDLHFLSGWPIMNAQYFYANLDADRVFLRRMRAGGERWSSNHTITETTMTPPGIFSDPSFKALNSTTQLCYTNPALINAVAQLAINYFDGAYAGQGLPEGIQGMGDYLAFVPYDNSAWCNCSNCQAILNISRQDRRGDGYFSRAGDSYYIFNFVNEVAKIVGQVHPDKYIAPLAYMDYFYKPLNLQLQPNIAPAPCMHTCYAYVPDVFNNDMAAYNEWVADSRATGRPLYMWNYFHHPIEPSVYGGWKCFPAFIPHAVSREVKRYINDGIHGVYLCGIPQQLDYYIYMKTAFDVTTDVDELMDEFFTLYFGDAGAPLKQFYLRIEQIHQTEGVLGTDIYKSWGYLGTPDRMAELGAYIQQAVALSANASSVIQQRVNSWKVGVWDYMKAGFDAYQGTGLPTHWGGYPDDTPSTINNISGPAPEYLSSSGRMRILNYWNQKNSIGWNRTAPGSYNNINIRFSFEATSGSGAFSFLMLDTDAFGVSGICPTLANASIPSLPNTFGLGFDCSNNTITTCWNNDSCDVPTVSYDFMTGSHTAMLQIENTSGGAYMTLAIDGTTLHDRMYIQGMHPYESRVGIMASNNSWPEPRSYFYLHGFRVEYTNRADR